MPRVNLDVLTDRFFDGASLVVEPATVRVRDGVIERIDRGVNAPAPGRPTLDARGSLLAPGLVNAHVHIARGGMFEPTEPPGVTQGARNLAGSIAAGVTTVGDMGCSAPLARAMREHVKRHPTSGPSIVASGPLVTAPKGYPLDWMPSYMVSMGIVHACGTEREGERAVGEIARAGMDHVKLAIMHRSYGDRLLPALTPTVARAVVDEAHRLGLRALAHAHTIADYQVALDAGVDALMHSSFEPLDARMVARIRDAGIAVCPTLWVFESACLGAEMRFDRDERWTSKVEPAIRRSWTRFAEAYAESGDVIPPGIAGGTSKARALESVRIAAANLALLRDAGVPIAFGNDANYGFSLVARPVDELGAMMRAGMNALACLESATSGAASLLGLRDRGRIATGMRADLVVLPREAEHDITAVERVAAVVASGLLVPDRDASGRARSMVAMAKGLALTVTSGLARMMRS